MARNNTVEITLRLILLVLFSTKLVVVTLSQIDLIHSMYSVNELLERPMLILKLNLFLEPLIILLGLIGVFIKRQMGFVFMLLLPSLIFSYYLLLSLTQYFSLESAWAPILLSVIFYILINLKKIRFAHQIKTIKQAIFLNIFSITIGLILSILMYLFNGKLGII